MTTKPKGNLQEEATVNLVSVFSKCAELIHSEGVMVDKIVKVMKPLLSSINKPIRLHPQSLGETFRHIREASLAPGAVVVMVDSEERISSRSLRKFDGEDFISILRDCLPGLQELVSGRKRAEQIKPALAVKLRLAGSQFLIDRRTYRLLVSNSGGDCRNLRISTKAGGRTKVNPPFDLNSVNPSEIDLGLSQKDVEPKQLELGITCKDLDGLEYWGTESIRAEQDDWKEVPLSLKA
jgi:hypothetical protein